MDQEKIGKFISKLRKEKKLTQQALALKLGVTDRAISKWETGRGMPDYSLLKPLCQELGITINELLNGEKISQDLEKVTFEQNILNTLSYTKKEIKHTKLIFKIIISIIIISFVSVIIMFLLDVNKMRNNEPVIFSTWGFKYAPPLDLDGVNLEKVIKEYLILEEEETKHYENEKAFVAMKTYLISEKKDKIYVYAFVLLESYYLDQEEIIKDQAYAIPHKFILKKVNDTYQVLKSEIPRDGGYYAKDMKQMFPNSVLKEIEKVHTDGSYLKLEASIKEQVELYFHNS